MTTSPVKLLSLACALVLPLAACGDDATEGKLDPDRIVVVDTLVQPTQLVAGGTGAVTCAAATAAGAIVNDGVYTVVVDPPGAASVNGMAITSTTAGSFTVACRHEAAALVDDTPVSVTVIAGAPVRSVMTATPATVAAGQDAALACYVADSYGNNTGAPTYVAGTPEGLTLTDTTASGTTAGSFTLTCVTNAVDAALYGTTPLTVTAGPMAKMSLRFTPDKPAYGLGEAIKVEGVGEDAFGNPTGDAFAVANLTATPTGHLSFVGASQDRIRFDLEGKYLVRGEATDASGLSAEKPLVVDQTPPALVVTAPERGTVHDTATLVNVKGTVSDNLGEVASLTIAGRPVTLPPAGGAFDFPVGLEYGINILDVVALDPYGNKSTITRAAEKSTEYYAMAGRTLATDGVDNAVVLVLTQEAIDDGVRDEPTMDDLASVFKVLVDNLDISAFIQNPLASFSCLGGNCTLDFSGIETTSTNIALTLQNGKIHMRIELVGFRATITLWVPCGIPVVCQSNPQALPGSATADKVVLETDIVLSVASGQTESRAENTVVTVENFGVDINDPTGVLQGFVTGALTWIEGPLIDGLEVVLAGLVEEQIGSALGSLFDALAISQTFEIPSPVGNSAPNVIALETAADGIDISPERLQLRLAGVAYAQAPVRPFPSLGSIGHRGCAPYTALTFPPPAPMVVGLQDSLINELLFAVWEGGTLSLAIGPGEAGELSIDLPIADLELEVEPLLPPVYNSCGDGGERLQLGDLYLDLRFNLGGPAHVALWLQTEAAVTLAVGTNEEGGTQVALALGDLDPLFLEVVENEGYFAGDDQAVIDLITSLVPQLLATVTESARFDLPTIDLGALTPAVPAGTVLNLDVRSIGRDNAYLTVNAALK